MRDELAQDGLPRYDEIAQVTIVLFNVGLPGTERKTLHLERAHREYVVTLLSVLIRGAACGSENRSSIVASPSLSVTLSRSVDEALE